MGHGGSVSWARTQKMHQLIVIEEHSIMPSSQMTPKDKNNKTDIPMKTVPSPLQIL